MKKVLVSILLVTAAVAGSVAFTSSSTPKRGNDAPSPWGCCMEQISGDG